MGRRAEALFLGWPGRAIGPWAGLAWLGWPSRRESALSWKWAWRREKRCCTRCRYGAATPQRLISSFFHSLIFFLTLAASVSAWFAGPFGGQKLLAPRAWCLVAGLVCVGWLQSLFPRWVFFPLVDLLARPSCLFCCVGPGAPGLFPVCFKSPVPAALGSSVEATTCFLHMSCSPGSGGAAIRPEQQRWRQVPCLLCGLHGVAFACLPWRSFRFSSVLPPRLRSDFLSFLFRWLTVLSLSPCPVGPSFLSSFLLSSLCNVPCLTLSFLYGAWSTENYRPRSFLPFC